MLHWNPLAVSTLCWYYGNIIQNEIVTEDHNNGLDWGFLSVAVLVPYGVFMGWSLVCVTPNDNRHGLQQQETKQKTTAVNGQDEMGMWKKNGAVSLECIKHSHIWQWHTCQLSHKKEAQCPTSPSQWPYLQTAMEVLATAIHSIRLTEDSLITSQLNTHVMVGFPTYNFIYDLRVNQDTGH